MRIYKFRKLTNETDYCQLRNILETGYFWCSNFWELNDPMEGIFSTYDIDIIDKIFKAKEQYKICSFSGEKGFRNPTMWGYYTDGFRGVAIEVEAEIEDDIIKDGVKPVTYKSDVADILANGGSAFEIMAKKILIKKLKAWEHEDEYRFLIKSDNNYHKIGEITAVYFGAPYGDLVNSQTIRDNSKSIRKYMGFKKGIIKVAKEVDITYPDVKVIKGVVTKV